MHYTIFGDDATRAAARNTFFTAGTVTVSTPVIAATQTWNDAAVTFIGHSNDFTVTAAAAGSLLHRWRAGAAGTTLVAQLGHLGLFELPLALSATTGIRLGADVDLYRSAANVMRTPDSLTVDGNLTGVIANFSGKATVTIGLANAEQNPIGDAIIVGASRTISSASGNLVVQSNDDFAINLGGSISLGARAATSSNASFNFAQISGRKINSTTSDLSGYIALAVHDNIAGMRTGLTIDNTLATTLAGNLTVSGTAASLTAANSTSNSKILSENTSNAAAASHAYFEAAVGGTTSTGDPHVRFTIPGGTSWYAGVDNSDSDKFIIGIGTAVGTTPELSFAAGGGGGATFAGPLTVTTAFGCNSKTPQAAVASGGALAAYGAGTNGLDSGANMSALHALVVAIRAALVADGIMS